MPSNAERIPFRLLRAACLAAALLACARPALADYSREAVGTSTGQFLKIAVSARGAALGEAYSALADDASALYWNPAGLIGVSSNSATFMHAPYLADTNLEYMAYAHSLGETGTYGLSVQYMRYGEIQGTDEKGLDTGTFSPYEMALTLGFATYVSGFNKFERERFVLGVNAKLVTSKITEQDTTVAADAGLLTPYLLDDSLRLALSFSNIMGSLRYYNEARSLPVTMRVGSRLLMTTNWDILCDFVAVRDNYPFLALGTEVRVPLGDTLHGALRGGFNTRAISDYEGLRNISLGFGLGGNTLGADYAYSPFGELGTAHRISLNLAF